MYKKFRSNFFRSVNLLITFISMITYQYCRFFLIRNLLYFSIRFNALRTSKGILLLPQNCVSVKKAYLLIYL